MFKLVKNELYKIFHKKSTYITLIIGLLFLVLVNYIYQLDTDSILEDYGYSTYTDMDSEMEDDEYTQAYRKSYLETEKLAKNYEESWQKNALYDEYAPVLNDYYVSLYQEDENAFILQEQAANVLKEIEAGNWQYFMNRDIENLEAELKALTVTNKEEQKNQDCLTKQIELYKYALANNINQYSDDYLAEALNNAIDGYQQVVEYKYENDIKEKEEYEPLVKEYYENEYILYNKVDTNNTHTLRNVFINLLDEMEIIVLVFIIMIAGTLISEEFNKGTIKNLLTVPYTRGQIITAKFLTCLLMIPFIMLFILLAELVIGGLFFGYSSLSVPVVNYIVKSSSYSVLNVLVFYLISFLAKMPMYVLLATLAFTLSTLILNTAFAITITFLGYIGSEIINALALTFKLKFINYFVTPNWNLTPLLFGGKSAFGLSLTHSLIVCFVYFIIMIVAFAICFKKRNVKNI